MSAKGGRWLTDVNRHCVNVFIVPVDRKFDPLAHMILREYRMSNLVRRFVAGLTI